MGQWFLIKKQGKSSSIDDIGPRSRNDLDLQYSQYILNQLVYGHRLQKFQNNPLSSVFPTEKSLFKKKIRAGSDLLLNISLSGGQSFKVEQIMSAKRE